MSRFGREVANGTTVRIDADAWGLSAPAIHPSNKPRVYFGCPFCGAPLCFTGTRTADGLALELQHCHQGTIDTFFGIGCGATFYPLFMGWRERTAAPFFDPPQDFYRPANRPSPHTEDFGAVREGFFSASLPADVVFRVRRDCLIPTIPQRPTGTHHPSLCQADGFAE